MSPAIINATAFQSLTAHAFLPTAEVLRDWGNSRSVVPSVLLTDSGIWFDYQAGTVCSDGLTRKGKCLIENRFGTNGLGDTCIFTAYARDSFALFGNKGPVYFVGQIKMHSRSAYSLEISGIGEVKTPLKPIPFEAKGTIKLDAEGQPTRSAKFRSNWNADFAVTGQEWYHYEVSRTTHCFPFFSTGNGHSASKEIRINFNPFSDGACDPVVKFTSGREEWLEDLW